MKYKKIKSRYLSVKLDGSEIYAENLATDGNIKNSLKLGRDKLGLLKQALPKGDWTLTIEQQEQKENGDTHFEILDVETGELQKQVL